MNLNNMVNNYIDEGYNVLDANAKVCQDILLLKIAKSTFSRNITIKGGVVMHNISKNVRRATQDMDIDFIKYSLNDDSIYNFINTLNKIKDGIKLKIIEPIVKLKHQDYDGKRVIIELRDKENNIIETKLDIGVHKNFDINQDEYIFSLDIIDKTASLLINSKEQIFIEKLKSLLKFGITSTRYKDIFDMYYLIKFTNLNIDNINLYIEILIFNDKNMLQNNYIKIIERLEQIFNNKNYINSLLNAKKNWIDIPVLEVTNCILDFLKELNSMPVM